MNNIQNLRLVEIELFNYCNRTCPWCPNKFIDRKTFSYLNWDIFIKLIDELAQNNYKGAITFSRYNEPLSDVNTINKAIYYIKNKLPSCKCITNTNGDFLTKKLLKNLKIDELTIMDYDGIGADNAIKKLKNWGATVDKIQEKYIYAHYNSMQILYYLNWQINRHITDRGGLLLEYMGPKRDRPCYEPKYFTGINFDGTVSPCCNIRNDCEKTQKFILGDLHYNSLSEILSSKKYNNFLKNCLNNNYENLECCQTCDNLGGRYTRGKGGISYE